ncbi:MAG: response regulator [Gammaproteobacteria bacterium]|nr:response regulator [Gammaproteobacteria bacterium]
MKRLGQQLHHLHTLIIDRVAQHGAQYQAYGLFGCLNAPIYYLIWHYVAHESYESSGWRLLSFSLCLPLVLHKQWPQRLRPLMPLYWYATLWITLPVFFSYMLVMNAGSPMWIANNIVIVFFLLLLVDYQSAVVLLITGSLLGATVGLLGLEASQRQQLLMTFNYNGFMLTYLVSILIGALFLRNRERLEALQRQTIQLEAESQEKSAFIANMSHDLRTPLSGLLTLSDGTLDSAQDLHTLQQRLTIIHHSAKQLYQLFESLLETAELDQPISSREPAQTFSLTTLLNTIIHLCQPAITAKNLTMTPIHREENRVTLRSYPLTIQRVVMNLMSNAIRYTEQGTITLTWTIRSLGPDHGLLSLSVLDTGCGIAPADQKRIFRAFTRLTPAYKNSVYSGVGLGLYNAKQMVDNLGGNISVISDGPEQGSTFTITLPVDRMRHHPPVTPACHNTVSKTHGLSAPIADAPIIAPVSEKVNSQAPTACHILLVEDTQTTAQAAKYLLTSLRADCEITLAVTAAEATHLCTQQTYTLVFMDLGLPDGDGRDVSKCLLTSDLSKNCHTPIIAVTAHANETIRQECLEIGIKQVIHKPLTVATIQAIFAQYGLLQQTLRKIKH